MRLGAALVSILFVPACITIGPLAPDPDIVADPRAGTLRLALSADIPDHLVAGLATVNGWRTTLARGFTNGFGEAYRLAKDADVTLTLDEVDLEIGKFTTRIQFKATMTRRDGTVLFRSGGTAMKHVGGAVENVSGAVEAMYEQIGRDLQNAEAREAADQPLCVSGRSVACVGPRGCQGFQVCDADGAFGACSCGG